MCGRAGGPASRVFWLGAVNMHGRMHWHFLDSASAILNIVVMMWQLLQVAWPPGSGAGWAAQGAWAVSVVVGVFLPGGDVCRR